MTETTADTLTAGMHLAGHTSTQLDEARTWVDDAVAGGYLGRTTGSWQQWALGVLIESDDPADVERALRIRNEWNREAERWAGWSQFGRTVTSFGH